MHLSYHHRFIGGEYTEEQERKYWVGRGYVVLKDTVEVDRLKVLRSRKKRLDALIGQLAQRIGTDD